MVASKSALGIMGLISESRTLVQSGFDKRKAPLSGGVGGRGRRGPVADKERKCGLGVELGVDAVQAAAGCRLGVLDDEPATSLLGYVTRRAGRRETCSATSLPLTAWVWVAVRSAACFVRLRAPAAWCLGDRESSPPADTFKLSALDVVLAARNTNMENIPF